MKIKSKLLLGFSSIILLTIILGLVSYYSINVISTKLVPVMKANERITSNMLQLRRNEKDFLARSLKDPSFFKTGQSKYLDSFNNNYNGIQTQLKIVKAFSSDSEYLDKVKKINDLVNQYKTQFFNVVNKEKEKGFKDWGRIGDLRTSVHKVESKLKKAGKQDALLVKMLMSRRHEKDYFLRNDVKYQQRLASRIKEFNALLPSSGLNKNTQSELSTLIQSYKEKFDSVVLIDEEVGRTSSLGLMGKYRKTIHLLEPLIKKQSKFLDKEVNSLVSISNMTVIIAILLVIVLGIGAALRLSRKISKPLMIMTEAGKKVAEGDLNVSIPKIETGDEVQDIGETINMLIGAIKFHKEKRAW